MSFTSRYCGIRAVFTGFQKRVSLGFHKIDYQAFEVIVLMALEEAVDQYIPPDKKTNQSTLRRQIDSLLDTLDDKEFSVVEATIKGLCKAKEQTEE